jgi:hypothetical protein
MTPIKEIWVVAQQILFLDSAGQLNSIADGYSEEGTLLLADLLGDYHKKDVYRFDVDKRGMVLYKKWLPKEDA